MNKYLPVNSVAVGDPRQCYRFDVIRYVDDDSMDTQIRKWLFLSYKKRKISAGWSLTIFAADKRDAIKRFVAMTSPTTRFEVIDISELQNIAA